MIWHLKKKKEKNPPSLIRSNFSLQYTYLDLFSSSISRAHPPSSHLSQITPQLPVLTHTRSFLIGSIMTTGLIYVSC